MFPNQAKLRKARGAFARELSAYSILIRHRRRSDARRAGGSFLPRLLSSVTAKLCKMAMMGSVSQMLDVSLQFSPHPCEIVGGHGIVAVSGVTRAVLQVLEPNDEVFASAGGARRRARRYIAQHGRGFCRARRDSSCPGLRARAFPGPPEASPQRGRPVFGVLRLSAAPRSGFRSAAKPPDRQGRRRAWRSLAGLASANWLRTGRNSRSAQWSPAPGCRPPWSC